MKKFISIAAASLILCGAAFSEGNYTKGFELTFAPEFAMTDFAFTYDTVPDYKFTEKYRDILGKVKLSMYDCFLFKDMFGIYAELGIPTGGYRSYTMTDSYQGTTEESKDGRWFYQGGIEAVLGPAFGMDIGSTDIRLQASLGCHIKFVSETLTDAMVSGDSMKFEDLWLGFGLDVQAKFFADRRLSLIAGVQATYDPLWYEWEKYTDSLNGVSAEVYNSNTESSDYIMRGAISPYVAFGINF